MKKSLILLVAVAVLVGGGFFASQKGYIDLSRFTKASVPSDWKTYRNDQYGFEVKYPADWKVQFGKDSTGRTYLTFSAYVDSIHDFSQAMQINSDTAFHSLGSLDKNIANLKQVGDISSDEKETDVSNGKAFYGWADNEGGALGSYSYAILVSSNAKYDVQTDGPLKVTRTASEALFLQILSTFKFVQPNANTADWKTYTNNQYKFSLKYPADWIVTVRNSSSSEDTPIVRFKNPRKPSVGGDIPQEQFYVTRRLNVSLKCESYDWKEGSGPIYSKLYCFKTSNDMDILFTARDSEGKTIMDKILSSLTLDSH